MGFLSFSGLENAIISDEYRMVTKRTGDIKSKGTFDLETKKDRSR